MGWAVPTPTDAGMSSPKGPASSSVHEPVPPPPPLRLHACVSLCPQISPTSLSSLGSSRPRYIPESAYGAPAVCTSYVLGAQWATAQTQFLAV